MSAAPDTPADDVRALREAADLALPVRLGGCCAVRGVQLARVLDRLEALERENERLRATPKPPADADLSAQKCGAQYVGGLTRVFWMCDVCGYSGVQGFPPRCQRSAAMESEAKLDTVRQHLAESGAPTLAELTERFKGWTGPEVSGSLPAKKGGT